MDFETDSDKKDKSNREIEMVADSFNSSVWDKSNKNKDMHQEEGFQKEDLYDDVSQPKLKRQDV